MENLERYKKVFVSIFKVGEEELNGHFIASSVEKWDSITHLALITALEDEFDIMIDPEDLLRLRSYELGLEIMQKYEVSFE